MPSKDAFLQQQSARLAEWRAEIERLRAKAKVAQADARVEYERRLESLQAKEREASQKLEELKQKSGDAWESVKGGVEKAWDDLGSAIAEARQKFD